MATYTAKVLTEWDSRFNNHRGELPSITIGPFATEKRTHQAIKRELNKRFPGQWVMDAGQYVHVKSGAGCYKLAYINEHLTEREKIEREIATLEATIGDLPQRLATAKAKLKMLEAAEKAELAKMDKAAE